MSLLDKASLIVTPNSYKTSKLYSVIPNTTLGDMDVVRATTATRVNASSLIESVGLNIPRIDYTNGSCPSLLVEPQRTNLVTYSEQFNDASWVKSIGGTGVVASVVSNAGVSPSGLQDADLITLNSGTGTTPSDQAKVLKNISGLTTGVSYSESIWLKGVNGGEQVLLGISNIGTLKATLTTEWKRFVLTGISGGTFNSVGVQIRRGLFEPLNSYAQFYAWGSQLEAGSYPTSYIPTVASTVTRNADVISKTGISSLIGTTYTVYGEIINEGIHNARHLALKLPTGGNYTDVVFIVQNFNGLQATANNSTSTAQFTINSGSYSIGQTLKYALRCEQNNVAFYINGVQIGVDTLCTIPVVSTLYLGTYVDLQLGSKIKSTMIFPSALTNTELAQLTTL